jgi:hypothetical protein
VAARRWLDTHYSTTAHPGAYRQDREATRDALYFYYCRSLAYAFNAVGEIAQRSGELNWRNELADELMRRQRADGAWINAAVDVREDDPLIATPFAVMALVACQGSHEPTNPSASTARP